MSQGICPNCQRRIRPGARFCGHCGTTLPALAAAPQPSAAHSQPTRQATPAGRQVQGQAVHPPPAPQGQPINPPPPPVRPGKSNGKQRRANPAASANVCPNCGNAVRPGGHFCGSCGQPLPQPRGKKSRLPLILGLIGILLAFVAVALLGLFWNEIFPAEENTPTPTLAVTVDPTTEAPEVVVPEETAEPTEEAAQPTPTESPVLTEEPTAPAPSPTPDPTNTTAPTEAPVVVTPVTLLEETFAQPVVDRIEVYPLTAVVVADAASFAMTGSVQDRMTYKTPISLANETEITFRLQAAEPRQSSVFRLDMAASEIPAAFADAPLSLHFQPDRVILRIAEDETNWAECKIASTAAPLDGDKVTIRVHEEKSIEVVINETPVTECKALNQPLYLKENATQVQISFAGSFTLLEFKVDQVQNQ